MFGPTEVSLRDALRNETCEADLIKVISNAVKKKKKKHAGRLLFVVLKGSLILLFCNLVLFTALNLIIL